MEDYYRENILNRITNASYFASCTAPSESIVARGFLITSTTDESRFALKSYSTPWETVWNNPI